jgi:hypothetical protein
MVIAMSIGYVGVDPIDVEARLPMEAQLKA